MLIVYKIKHNESANEYIGSTKNLNLRMIRHRANLTAKDKCHFRLYKFINENGGWDNFTISILACLDELQFLDIGKKEILEQKYIDKYHPTLNEKNAYQTTEQRLEKCRLYNKSYGNHLYNCECGREFKYKNKAKHYRTKRHREYITNKCIQRKHIIITFE